MGSESFRNIFFKYTKVIVRLLLIALLVKFYLIDLINQHASKLTNTSIYEEKLALVNPPTLTVCTEPEWKHKLLRTKYNTSKLIFNYPVFSNPFDDLFKLFNEATFQLNVDYNISYYTAGELHPLTLGMNKIKDYKIEVKSVQGMNHGQCYAIIPIDIRLKPGQIYNILLEHRHNFSDSIDHIKKFSIRLTTQDDDYLNAVWNGVPGIKPKEIVLDANERSVTIFIKEAYHEFIKDCNSDAKMSVFQNFAKEIVANVNQYNCSNICTPLDIVAILKTIKHDWLQCFNLEDYYCMSSGTNLDIMSGISQSSTKSCMAKYIEVERAVKKKSTDGDNGGWIGIWINMGAYSKVYQEYFVTDTLDLIGTAGGIFGLFIGFSFYDAVATFLDFVAKKLR